MAQLNANIPYIRCYVRNKFLDGKRGLTECYIFGVKSVLNNPLGFHCQLNNGAVFWSLPISAFVHSPQFQMLGHEQSRLSTLQRWDCQSSDIAVTTFAFLQGYKVDVRTKSKQWMAGKYMFTIDDYYSDLNALPLGYANDSDSKCFHFIKLYNGNFTVQPNNFLRWHNLNFVDPYDINHPPKYKPLDFDLKSEWE